MAVADKVKEEENKCSVCGSNLEEGQQVWHYTDQEGNDQYACSLVELLEQLSGHEVK